MHNILSNTFTFFVIKTPRNRIHNPKAADAAVVSETWVQLPGVQYANIHTEQRYFIAYLCRYGCLSQDSTPHSQTDSHLYT